MICTGSSRLFGRVRISHLSFLVLACGSSLVLGQTKAASPDDMPPLRPPRSEILPTFWERHEVMILIACIFVLFLLLTGIWFLTRPKPPIIVPPAAKARDALNGLRNQPETGELLSKISQVIRSYFAAAFNFPQGEFTTAEFSRMVVEKPAVGASLAEAVVEFLRQCDQRKFAQPSPAPPLGAVSCAVKLIDEAETRRAASLPKVVPR